MRLKDASENRWADLVEGVVESFRDALLDAVADLQPTKVTPERFRGLLQRLRQTTNEAGRQMLERMLPDLEETAEVVEQQGTRYRFKERSEKEWLSLFGSIRVSRRYYQPDVGGDGILPLDLRCGMARRFLTPDLEEIAAFSAALLVPREIETLMRKLLPQGPSATAIQEVIREVGTFANDFEPELEDAMKQEAPLSTAGDVLAVSWDGVTVPLREKGSLRGRPAERPGIRHGSTESPTAWKEASVGLVSMYRHGTSRDLPEQIDCRYFARMPEPGMQHLLDRIEWTVRELREQRTFRDVAVLCDGKPAIWNVVQQLEVFRDAVPILDFYHAAVHLSTAAEAIFGKQNERATRWFEKYRVRMRDKDGGTRAVLRSLRYYLGKLRNGSQRFDVVRRTLSFFRKNLDRMDYAGFRQKGLPIGSGPVEAACKTVVGFRLKRSGMRWSREGGQCVLNLRLPVLSHRWDTFWSTYEARRAA